MAQPIQLHYTLFIIRFQFSCNIIFVIVNIIKYIKYEADGLDKWHKRVAYSMKRSN